MINPIKMLKNYNKTNITSKELELSGEFIQWALYNKYDLFRIAYDKTQFDICVREYKKYLEGWKNENKSI